MEGHFDGQETELVGAVVRVEDTMVGDVGDIGERVPRWGALRRGETREQKGSTVSA